MPVSFDTRCRVLLLALAAVTLLAGARSAPAHHSYSMFDASKHLKVSGTVAKLEWINPHVFIWVYVPSASAPGKHDLYAFENASIGVLTRLGWTSSSLKAGDKITVEYWPLRDGRTGGHFDRAILADGRVLIGAGAGSDAPGRAPRPELDLPRSQSRNP